MKSFVFIEGLKINTIIGIHPHERTSKQPIIIDLKIKTDTTDAANSDNINHTLDYQELTDQLIEFIERSKFKLIESLAEECANQILQHPLVDSLKLKLSKPKALNTCENVGLIIYRKK